MSGYNDDCGLRGLGGFNHPDYGKLRKNITKDNQKVPTSNVSLANRDPEVKDEEIVDNDKNVNYKTKDLQGNKYQPQKLHDRDNVNKI